MSDDGYSGVADGGGGGGPGSAQASSRRVNPERRTPRFSWNTAYEETFFRSLCESMQMGYKENASFKTGAWERAAIALRDKHNEYPEKSHLVNKADNARKKFRMWRALREDPDFIYNPNTHMVSASEEAWQRHFAREHLIKALRGRPFEHEEYMEILFPDVIGSGGAPKRIMKPRRRGPDGNLIPRSPGNSSQTNGGDSADVENSRLSENGGAEDSFTASSLQPLVTAASTPHRPAAAAAATAASMQPPPPPPPPPAPHNSATAAGGGGGSSSSHNDSSILTPPDDHHQQQQQQQQQTPNNSNNNNTPHHAGQKRTLPIDPSVVSRPEKRRGRPSRFSSQFYQSSTVTPPPATFAANNNNHNHNNGSSSTIPPQQRGGGSTTTTTTSSSSSNPFYSSGSGAAGSSSNTASALSISQDAAPLLLQLAESLKSGTLSGGGRKCKWQEQAVDILFRDFTEEDLDLQLKIAEKALADDHKAMVFVKMTDALRKHYVARLRDVHLRTLPSSAVGGLGRVMEDNV